MRLSALITAVLLWPALAAAADNGVPIHLSATADDPVGARFAYRIKEEIRKSGQMQFVPSDSDAFVDLVLTTLDPDEDGLRTIYSLVVTVRDLSAGKSALFYYETSYVGLCGASAVNDCAESVAAKVDKVVDEYKAAFSKLSDAADEASKKDVN